MQAPLPKLYRSEPHEYGGRDRPRVAAPGRRRAGRRSGEERAGAVASLPPRMARRSLKPQLNQIRTWVRQGRTDAWVAHQLEVPVRDIGQFKREHDLVPTEAPEGTETTGVPVIEEEPDLRAEDDALIAAELDAEPEPEPVVEAPDGDEPADGDDAAPRRRGRRGGRGRRRSPRAAGSALEGTFDHGQEGYGLWLDPAVQDDAVYAEHWAGHRSVTVTVEPDRIVIQRAGEGSPGGESVTGGGDGSPSEP
jgi:hypothetical protein